MSTLLSFVRTAFRTKFAYRSSVFFGFLLSFVYLIVQIALWRFVFRQDSAMIKYMTAYVVVSQLLHYAYSTEIAGMIGHKVRSGDYAVDLIKPVTSVMVYWSTSLGGTLANIATRGLPVLLVFSPVFLDVAKLSLARLLVFLGACIAGYIMTNLIFALIGHLAFVTTEIWPFARSTQNSIRFLSGALIPIAFFPPWLAAIARFLPFRLLYSFPIRVLLEDLPAEEVVRDSLLLGAWLVLLSVLLWLVHKRAVWHSVVQGG